MTRRIGVGLLALSALAGCFGEDVTTEGTDVTAEGGLIGTSIGQSLSPGQRLGSKQSLTNNGFELAMQEDCNLVLYDWRNWEACTITSPRVLWSSGTWNQGSPGTCFADMQTDGNLVVYTTGLRALWSSRTWGRTNVRLDLQGDGNAVLYQGSGLIWATGTNVNPSNAPRVCRTTPPNFTWQMVDGNVEYPMANHGGLVPWVVICMDVGDGLPMPPLSAMQAAFSRTQEWYRKNSQGRYNPTSLRFVGCGEDGQPIMMSPAGHRGQWYENLAAQQGVDAMRKVRQEDTVRQALALKNFDIRSFDSNRDGKIDGSEVATVVVRSLANDSGSVVYASMSGFGLSKFRLADVGFSAADTNVVQRASLLAHELNHLLFGASDMYEGSLMFTPGQFSIMDDMSNLNGLDPLHALKLRWLNPQVRILQPDAVHIKTVETTGDMVIFYDPNLRDVEYFVVDFRQQMGVYVWRIIEQRNRLRNSPWASTYAGWMDKGLWGRYAVHRINRLPLGQGGTVDLQFTSHMTPYRLSVRTPVDNFTGVGVAIERRQ